MPGTTVFLKGTWVTQEDVLASVKGALNGADKKYDQVIVDAVNNCCMTRKIVISGSGSSPAQVSIIGNDSGAPGTPAVFDISLDDL